MKEFSVCRRVREVLAETGQTMTDDEFSKLLYQSVCDAFPHRADCDVDGWARLVADFAADRIRERCTNSAKR